VQQGLGLSYKSSNELNKVIDDLPTRPPFTRKQIVIGGDTFDVYFRDALECIRALFSDPEFAPVLVFLPERHYSDAQKTERLFHEMHTGSWWWDTQVCCFMVMVAISDIRTEGG
jgi:hypothetical protein